MSVNWKSRCEREQRRANSAEARLRMVEREARAACDVARKFGDDVMRGHLHQPPFAALAFDSVKRAVEDVYMLAIGVKK